MAQVPLSMSFFKKVWRRSVQLAVGAALFATPAYVSAVTINVSSTAGSTNRAANATALQGEIDAAILRAGPTTLVLTKGHEFNPIVLKKKTLDDAYIIIESSGYTDGTLPGPGVRVSPSDSANMPKMVGGTGTNGTQAVRTAAGAKHYILRGLEFFKADTASFYGLVSLGTDAHTLVADIPHHITIDQCYLWAADTQEMFRAINLHSGHTTVSNTYIKGAKSFPTSGDSQAMGAWNGTGPYWVVNNFLEGSTENFLVGGAGHIVEENPSDPNIPSDITFKQNYCPKRLEWLPDIDPLTGFPQWTVSSARNWQVKNLFEIKQGLRYDIQGNHFENTWGQYAGQEFSIVLKVTRNSTSISQTEALSHDLIFKYNRINHAPGGFATEGRVYSANWPPELRRFSLEHNLFEDITCSTAASGSGWGYTTFGFRGAFYYGAHGGYDVKVSHNTAFNNKSAMCFDQSSAPNDYDIINFTFTNNVIQGNGTDAIRYGGGGAPRGTAVLDIYTQNRVFAHNAIKGASTTNITGTDLTNNWFPTAWTAGDIMVNQATGNYNIVNPSTYWTNSSPGDGTPIGADFYTSSTDVTSVYTMTEDCVSGNWDAKDIVLYAKDATTKTSHWTVTSNALAAGEAYLGESDTGASQSTALASPTSYFELTFPAVANKPYRLMIRGKANGNSLNSDSVWVQFTNTLNGVGGSSAYRIGTTSAMEWRLQNGGSDTISSWGWRDTEIAGVTAEKQVIFSTTGTQTIRIQRKEDGVHIDQILLSPSTYLGRGPVDANPEVNPAWDSPGYEDNDTSILIATQGGGGGGGPGPSGEAIVYEDFNYTGTIGAKNGGEGFGSNAWTAVTNNPALATGTMNYTDSTGKVLITRGHKLQPALNNRAYRNLDAANQFVPENGDVLWIGFRINHTGTGALPSNHAGFALYSTENADSTGDEFFMGNPGFSGQNWGFNPEGGTRVVAPGDVSTGAPRDVFLLYKLSYGATNTAVSMWINPVMRENALGAPQATGTQPGLDPVRSILFSTGGTASGYQFDEFRMGPNFTDAVPAVYAYDNINYTGNLNTQNGGTGWGGAWTAVSGSTNPALATGTMTYSDGTNSLVVGGNKIQPAVSSRSSRNIATANQFVPATGESLWVSFRINHTGTGSLPSNHAGFALYTTTDGNSTGDEFFMGNPGFSGQNWGFNPEGGTRVVAPGTVSGGEPRDVLLVYRLDYGSTNTDVSMWINPSLSSAGALGTPDATGTQPGLDAVRSVIISTGGTASGYQLDELRIGNAFAAVAPKQ